jgi:protein-S-isoprenylcysteine O-methyltransferase Ste14
VESLASAVLAIGTTVGTVLIALLLVTLAVPQLRIWPTPGAGTWQSYVFWPLFRSLNVLCFAAAIVDRTPWLGLAGWFRLSALVFLGVSIAVFVYSFRVLGRDNSYCATDGLVTRGIYRWSRNPQNAMLIVVYGCLAMASDSMSAIVLCTAMMAVYALMVFAEEPWLHAAYGDAYRRYCSRVPRFFNWRRAFLMVHAATRRPRRLS